VTSFARCHWPSPCRAPTPKPNGGSANRPAASGLNGKLACNRCAAQRPPSSRYTKCLRHTKYLRRLATSGALPRTPGGRIRPGAAEAIAGNEFIFDVQTHRVDLAGTWRSSAGKILGAHPGELPARVLRVEDPIACFSAEQFIKHVFTDSDTDLAVLSLCRNCLHGGSALASHAGLQLLSVQTADEVSDVPGPENLGIRFPI
jgi:hypothetical protein